MESRQQWLTRLKNELSNSPLASNVAFGFILMGLEKLVELEFECPCNPTWNGVFSSAFFIIPAVMAFTLMLIIQGCRCDTWCKKSVSLSSFVPAIVWLILLFLDGQYFACAMTDWKGRFVLVDKAAPQKWCEPTSEGDVPPQELMLRSQQLFVVSQVSYRSTAWSCVESCVSPHCCESRRKLGDESGGCKDASFVLLKQIKHTTVPVAMPSLREGHVIVFCVCCTHNEFNNQLTCVALN